MPGSRRLFKLGPGVFGTDTPVSFPHVCSAERATGPERPRSRPCGEAVALLLSGTKVWRENDDVLHVLLVPRPGRCREP